MINKEVMIRYGKWYYLVKSGDATYLNGKRMRWYYWLLGDVQLLLLILIGKESWFSPY